MDIFLDRIGCLHSSQNTERIYFKNLLRIYQHGMDFTEIKHLERQMTNHHHALKLKLTKFCIEQRVTSMKFNGISFDSIFLETSTVVNRFIYLKMEYLFTMFTIVNVKLVAELFLLN